MRSSILLVIIINAAVFIQAQNSQNPFDLSTATPPNEQVTPTVEKDRTVEKNRNPFDLSGEESNFLEEEQSVEVSSNQNPFDLGVESPGVNKQSKPDLSTAVPVFDEEEKTDEHIKTTATDGWILGLTMFILALTTFIFIFFRSLYSKIYGALLNDNQLSLLYRERKGGAMGRFFIAYGLFFLSGGFFIYLALVYFNFLPEEDVLKRFVWITASFAGVFILKHLVLALIGYVFPISKEVRLYSFSIMVFSIMLGVLMPFIDLILAYSTPEGKKIIIYIAGIIVVLVYLLRSLRSIFIANRFIFHFSFHFLLYLCAVEIAPVMILYKILCNFNI